HCRQNMRVAVAEYQRPLAQREIQVLVAVHIKDVAAAAVAVEERVRSVELPELAGNTPRQRAARALVQRLRLSVTLHRSPIRGPSSACHLPRLVAAQSLAAGAFPASMMRPVPGRQP